MSGAAKGALGCGVALAVAAFVALLWRGAGLGMLDILAS